jgi:transposase-like protein
MGKNMMLDFKWRHFQEDIIMMSVRWYLSYSLSYRDIFLYLEGLWPHIWVEDRQIKYLNNIIEQDYRDIKRRTNPMLGFKSVASAESTIAG